MLLLQIQVASLEDPLAALCQRYWQLEGHSAPYRFTYSVAQLAAMFPMLNLAYYQIPAAVSAACQVMTACESCGQELPLSIRNDFQAYLRAAKGRQVWCESCATHAVFQPEKVVSYASFPPIEYSRQARPLLGHSGGRRQYYQQLMDFFGPSRVHPTVRMSALLDNEVIGRIGNQLEFWTLDYFYKAGLSFVITDEHWMPRLAIDMERDGEQPEKRKFKDMVLTIVGIYYYQLPVDEALLFRKRVLPPSDLGNSALLFDPGLG